MTNNGKRVAWVTGGGSGIGESGAEHLAADGWTVVVSGRRKQELDRVVANIAKKVGKEILISPTHNRGFIQTPASRDLMVGWAKRSVPTTVLVPNCHRWARRKRAFAHLVLARRITMASFREEWPSLGGHPGWAADRSDRCPPKP